MWGVSQPTGSLKSPGSLNEGSFQDGMLPVSGAGQSQSWACVGCCGGNGCGGSSQMSSCMGDGMGSQSGLSAGSLDWMLQRNLGAGDGGGLPQSNGSDPPPATASSSSRSHCEHKR